MHLFKNKLASFFATFSISYKKALYKNSILSVFLVLGSCSIPATAGRSTALIPSVTVACDTCVTYQDLKDKAFKTAYVLGWGNITPPGYPAGTVASPRYTLILVSASNAPRSYAFTYTSHVHRCAFCDIPVNVFTYEVFPVTTYAEPSDVGATVMDGLLYKALRLSGLPIINLPPFDDGGNALSTNSEYEVITAAVTHMMPTVGIPGALKTLPGLFNWTLFPSFTVIYQGKSYTIYEGEEVNIKFADGSTLTLIVTVGGYGGSPGIFRVKSAAPIKVPNPATSQPGISLNILDPFSQTYTGNSFFVYGNYNGVVVSSPIDYNYVIPINP